MYHWEGDNEWDVQDDKEGAGHEYSYPQLGGSASQLSPGELRRGQGSTRQARSRNIRFTITQFS